MFRFVGVFLIFLAWLFVRTSCSVNRNEPVIVLTSAEAEDHYPGVFSNLRSVRSYTLSFSASITDSILLVAIETDSVSIPVESWAVKDTRKSGLLVSNIDGEFTIRASRNFYQTAHKTMVEEAVYEPSGYNISAAVRLVYQYRGVVLRSNEVAICVSKPVYHE